MSVCLSVFVCFSVSAECEGSVPGPRVEQIPEFDDVRDCGVVLVAGSAGALEDLLDGDSDGGQGGAGQQGHRHHGAHWLAAATRVHYVGGVPGIYAAIRRTLTPTSECVHECSTTGVREPGRWLQT